MRDGNFWALAHVCDEQLRSQLASLLGSTFRTEARIIAHIAEVEDRKLHLREGSPSLFDYCVKRLGLSESEAFHRITAARIARRFPIVFTMIEGRQIHITAVCLLRDHLTAENHGEVLAEASHKTKLQVQELLARRFPRPDVNSYIRKLPNGHVAKEPSTPHTSHADLGTLTATNEPRRVAEAIPEHAASARARIEPTSEARYRINSMRARR